MIHSLYSLTWRLRVQSCSISLSAKRVSRHIISHTQLIREELMATEHELYLIVHVLYNVHCINMQLRPRSSHHTDIIRQAIHQQFNEQGWSVSHQSECWTSRDSERISALMTHCTSLITSMYGFYVLFSFLTLRSHIY